MGALLQQMRSARIRPTAEHQDGCAVNRAGSSRWQRRCGVDEAPLFAYCEAMTLTMADPSGAAGEVQLPGTEGVPGGGKAPGGNTLVSDVLLIGLADRLPGPFGATTENCHCPPLVCEMGVGDRPLQPLGITGEEANGGDGERATPLGCTGDGQRRWPMMGLGGLGERTADGDVGILLGMPPAGVLWDPPVVCWSGLVEVELFL